MGRIPAEEQYIVRCQESGCTNASCAAWIEDDWDECDAQGTITKKEETTVSRSVSVPYATAVRTKAGQVGQVRLKDPNGGENELDPIVWEDNKYFKKDRYDRATKTKLNAFQQAKARAERRITKVATKLYGN